MDIKRSEFSYEAFSRDIRGEIYGVNHAVKHQRNPQWYSGQLREIREKIEDRHKEEHQGHQLTKKSNSESDLHLLTETVKKGNEVTRRKEVALGNAEKEDKLGLYSF